MTSTVRRFSVSNPPPTVGHLQGYETQQEAEVLELLAAQASRDGDESKAIHLMERALQIRCQVVTSLGEKASQCHAAAAAISSTATSPITNSVLAQRQRQEVATAASESHEQHRAAANELYDAAERLVTKCNVYAVQCFKKNDYETAEGLLAYSLQLTAEDAYPLCDAPDRRQQLRSTSFNNYGSLERNRGRFREALHYLRTSMEVTGSESPVAYMNMSAVLVQLRQCEEAAVAAARAVALLSCTPEDPSLLAVAHHNYAMALEPVDPQRSLEEYATAYQTACSTMGTHSAAAQSILHNWERFRRHHPHLAAAGASAGSTGAMTDVATPSKNLFSQVAASRTSTPPVQQVGGASHASAGRRLSKTPSRATSAAGGAASAAMSNATPAGHIAALSHANLSATGTRRAVPDPTASDLAEIFPHPFVASASVPKTAAVPNPTPMYRPTLTGPRKPLVPATQPHALSTTASRPVPPPVRHQRSTPQTQPSMFAATMQPSRQRPGTKTTDVPATRPTRPATATGPQYGAVGGTPSGYYVAGGGGDRSARGKRPVAATDGGRLSPVRPVTSSWATAGDGASKSGTSSRKGGARDYKNSSLLRPQRQPEKRLSAVGRHALPPLSTSADGDEADRDTSAKGGQRRSTRRTDGGDSKRTHSSVSTGATGDLQSYMNDRLDMLLHDEEELERKYTKAVMIQRVYRGHRARALVRERRENQARDARLLAIRRCMAARQIQRAYRQAQYGLYAATIRRLMGQGPQKQGLHPDGGQGGSETIAATQMQRIARGWLARRAAQRTRAYRANADPAARRVQTWYRGKLAQRELRRLREEQVKLRRGFYGEQYDYAATRIQTQWRAHRQYMLATAELDARRLHRLRERQRQQTEAAVRIQRGWRCAAARQQASELRAQRDAREAQRRLYEAQRKAAIRIQSFGRMVIVQQRAHPGLNEARLRAADKVRYARQNWAARTIQCVYRRHAAQRELQRRRHLADQRRQGNFQEIVVLRLQRVGRAYLERLALSDAGEALAAEALRYIRGVATLRAQDAKEAAEAEAALRHLADQRATRATFCQGEDILRMEMELCEHRCRQEIVELEKSGRPAALVVSKHTRLFPEDDWASALARYPDLLHEAFVLDLVEACELLDASQVLDVTMRLGSLYVSYAVKHSSEVSSAWLDAKAAYAEFPRLYGIRAKACEEDAVACALALAALEAEAVKAAAELEAEALAISAAITMAAMAPDQSQQAQPSPKLVPAARESTATPDADEHLGTCEEQGEATVPPLSDADVDAEDDQAENMETVAEPTPVPGIGLQESAVKDCDVSLDVPMTLEEALAAERAKRAVANAEALRLESLREVREQAKQAFRQQRIAEANSEADLAPYLPGHHASVAQCTLSKASFVQSMRGEKAQETSAAAKAVAAHRLAEAQAAQEAADAIDRRRHAAATTIARTYRGHRSRQYRRTLAGLRDELTNHRADHEYRSLNPYVEYDRLRRHLGAGARLPAEVNPLSTRPRQATKTAPSDTVVDVLAAPAPAQTTTLLDVPASDPSDPPAPAALTREPAENEVTQEHLADPLPEAEPTSGVAVARRDPQDVLTGFVKVVHAKRERQLRLDTVQQLIAAAVTPTPTPNARSGKPVTPLMNVTAEHILGDSSRALESVPSTSSAGAAAPEVHAHTGRMRMPVPPAARPTSKTGSASPSSTGTELDPGAGVSPVSDERASVHFDLASAMFSSPQCPAELDLAVGREGDLGAEASRTSLASHTSWSQANVRLGLTPTTTMRATPLHPALAELTSRAEAPLGTRSASRLSYSEGALPPRPISFRESAHPSRVVSTSASQVGLAPSPCCERQTEEETQDKAARTVQAFMRRAVARQKLDARRESARQHHEAALAVEALLDGAATAIQRVFRGHCGRVEAEQVKVEHQAYLAQRMARALAEDAEETEEDEESHTEQLSADNAVGSAITSDHGSGHMSASADAAADDVAERSLNPHDTLPYSDVMVPVGDGTHALASAPSQPLEGDGPVLPRQVMTYPSEDAVVREVVPGESEMINSESWEEM